MGLMLTPVDKDMRMLSLVLKFWGTFFITIFPVGYWLKWGVAWHDAGEPLNPFDVKFHPVS